MPSETTVHVAMGLSSSTWLAAARLPGAETSRLHRIEGGDATGLLALLATPGIRKRPLLRSWERDMAELRTGDGRAVPLRAELDRLRRRLVLALELIGEAERAAALAAAAEAAGAHDADPARLAVACATSPAVRWPLGSASASARCRGARAGSPGSATVFFYGGCRAAAVQVGRVSPGPCLVHEASWCGTTPLARPHVR